MACPDPKDSLEVCFLDGRRQVGVRFTKNSAQSRGQEGAVGSSPPAEKTVVGRGSAGAALLGPTEQGLCAVCITICLWNGRKLSRPERI